jgi:putative sugar O-methyltransferase
MKVSRADKSLELLDLMLADIEGAPEIYQPTVFWRSGMASIVKDLREHGVATFRRQPSATAFYVPTYLERSNAAQSLEAFLISVGRVELVTRVTNRHLARYDHAVATGLDPAGAPYLAGASESLYGEPLEQFEFDGKRYSRSFLNYLRGLVFFKRAVPDANLRTVLEIGGGYGTLGELLLPRNPTMRYVDVDIPPVGFVATWYLRQLLGTEQVAGYDTTRSIKRIALDRLPPATVLCSWQLPRLEGAVDLFVNFISFQEMEPQVVENYVGQVTRLGARYVLLRNSITGKPVQSVNSGGLGVNEPVVRDSYLRMFDGYELIGSDRVLFGQTTEGGFASEVMILRKTGG